MGIHVIGLVITDPQGRLFEIRLEDRHLLLIDRATGATVFRSEPCPTGNPARDEWLWDYADAMAAIMTGHAIASDDDSGLLHDWLEQMDFTDDAAP